MPECLHKKSLQCNSKSTAQKGKFIQYSKRPSKNFKKAKWLEFPRNLDIELEKLSPKPKNYQFFVQTLRRISKRRIQSGCQHNLIPGLSDTSKQLINKYKELFYKDLFKKETLGCGTKLITAIRPVKRNGRIPYNKWICPTVARSPGT